MTTSILSYDLLLTAFCTLDTAQQINYKESKSNYPCTQLLVEINALGIHIDIASQPKNT